MQHFDSPDEVDITVGFDGSVWINIDGKCALRIFKAKKVIMDDSLRGSDVVAPREIEYMEQP